jgi:glycosyltransferase involved in cell wall biosynthesis
MRLSLSIFAHNEERNIGTMLESLFGQSVLKEQGAVALGVSHVEILCLANGCSDQTAAVAKGLGEKLPAHIDYRVIDMPQPGKSRAWNAYVHSLSDRAADFLVLMDADIEFEAADVLEQLVNALQANSHANVSTDTPVKSFGREGENLSLADRGSLAASGQKSLEGMLCGQLYCARASELRRIWLPPALPVEDGYLAAMVTTNGFTEPTDLSRIAWVPAARHFFRTHRSIGGFIAHEARIIVGSTINSWLFSILWTQGKHGHVGAFVGQRNHADADWLSRIIDQKVRAGGSWLIPKHFILWRLAPLKGQSLAKKLRLAPVALAATALNFLACLRANSILKRRNAAAYW